MKHAANALSVSRILILPALVIVYKNTVWFALLYLLAGLTDVLDGFIARKTNTQSKLGARLDSAADLVWFAVILFVLFRLAGETIGAFIPWIIAVTVIRCVNLLISSLKYHELVFLHTWANKLTGFLLFLCPLIIAVSHRAGFLYPVCAAAALSAVEEGLIHITSETPDINRRSIIMKQRSETK
ncbi:MAG: CDP-alcohol phosphatidyltransferase family protein [Clostridia bacterium]|nr:CDP-alcohol phosphatidyltransferase family protein [Clostridia bacterium]